MFLEESGTYTGNLLLMVNQPRATSTIGISYYIPSILDILTPETDVRPT